jgi:hypothetical protein
MDAATFIALRFRPGEAYQFDWSHEDVEIAGNVRKGPFARDAGDAARRPSAGIRRLWHVPTRGIYDNMKPAVTSLFTCLLRPPFVFEKAADRRRPGPCSIPHVLRLANAVFSERRAPGSHST